MSDEEIDDLEEEIEDIDLSNSETIEDKKDKKMKNNNLVAEDQLDDQNIDTPKKSNKLLFGLLGASAIAAVGGGGYWYLMNSDMDLSMPITESSPEREMNGTLNIESETKMATKLKKLEQNFNDKIEKLQAENDKLKKGREIQNADMKSFDERLQNVSSKKGGKALSEREIEKITSMVESRTKEKFDVLESRFSAIESDVLKNEANIKKTVKVSLTALKEAKSARKEQKENLVTLQSQLDSLKSFSAEIKSDKVEVTPELMKKLEKLEDEVTKIKKEKKTVTRKKVSIPLEVEITDKAYQEKTYKEMKKKSEVLQSNQKVYSMVGLADDTVYLRDHEDTDEILSYSVGSFLEGYGEILSISKEGKIKTESGNVKYQ